MKRPLLTSLCASSIALVMSLGAARANAADMEGVNLYVSVFGGAAFFEDYEFNFINGAGFRNPFSLEFETGLSAGGAIGIDGMLVEGLRTEIELAYTRAKPDSYGGITFVGLNPRGQIETVSVLMNAWKDIDVGLPITPYLGGGVGVGFSDGQLRISNGAGAQFSGNDTGFALQAGAGFQWDATDMIAFDVSYRLRGVLDAEFESSIGGFSMDSDDIMAHTLQIGISVSLPPM